MNSTLPVLGFVSRMLKARARAAWCGALVAGLAVTASARGQLLLDEKWADGSRAENRRPAQAAVWIGRANDVSVKPGALSVTLTRSSQKVWTYFSDSEPVTLKVGQKLRASVSFIPRGA